MAGRISLSAFWVTAILVSVSTVAVIPEAAAKRPQDGGGPGKGKALGRQKTTLENLPPSISGVPSTAVLENASYEFVPSASDPDGDPLTFSVANLPAWASFSSATGKLQGTPVHSDLGTTSDIQISVSDGQSTTALPAFAITVSLLPNHPPTLSGTPPDQVAAGYRYNFTPSASDPDGDTVSFGIHGRPSWASFNSANGQLGGEPGPGDVGTYDNIRIVATDGEDSAELPSFAIEVVGTATGGFSLMWDAPLNNIDGTPVEDLAGYRIYLGSESGTYNEVIEISNPGVTIYVFDQLTPGKYYVSVTAVDETNNESAPSEEVITNI